MSDRSSTMIERKPTPDEIERMLSGIKPKSISPDAADSMIEGIKKPLREGLKNELLTDEDMEQIRLAIDKHFYESVVIPGESVGVLAGLSMGEPSTQMALNAHRTAGISSKSTNEGIPRLQELLRATETQRAISMAIHFMERKTLAQIRDLIPLFVARDLSNFLDRVIVESKDSLPEEVWHRRFRVINNFTTPQPDYVLRLFLNKEELRRYRLTLGDVTESLRKMTDDITYIYSSNDLGIIDVYAQNPIFNEAPSYVTDENALLYYLRDIVLPRLRKQRLVGVDGITDAFPTRLEISSLIENWSGMTVTVDAKKAAQNGLELSEVVSILQKTGYDPNPVLNGNQITVGVTGNSSQLTEKLRATETLKELNTYWFLETNGSNLARVLAFDVVNSEITFCTDATEIYTVFGIQAARDYLLEEYIRILSADAYLDPRHLILLTDVMVNLGLLAAVTSTGVSRQKIGPLTRSAFEKPVEHFLRAAGTGEGEVITGVAASVYVGKKARIGINAFLAPIEEETAVAPVEAVVPTVLTLEDVDEDEFVPPSRPSVALPVKQPMTTRPSVPVGASQQRPTPMVPQQPPTQLTLEDAEPILLPVKQPMTTTQPPRKLPTRRVGAQPVTTVTTTPAALVLPTRKPLPRKTMNLPSGPTTTAAPGPSTTTAAPAPSTTTAAPSTTTLPGRKPLPVRRGASDRTDTPGKL